MHASARIHLAHMDGLLTVIKLNGNPNEICGGPWANSVYSTQCPLGKTILK